MATSWPTIGGAPRTLPCDTTPLVGTQVNVGARVGWLLRINRLGSPYGAMTASRWAPELGLKVNRDVEISKMERGLRAPTADILSRYETSLGYPAGTFRGVVAGVRRRLDPGFSSAFGRCEDWPVDELDEAVHAGTADGAQWLHLADVLRSPSARFLPRRLISEWMTRLVEDFTAARGLDVVPRMEALSMLIDTPTLSAQAEEIIWAETERTPSAAQRLIAVLGSSVRPDLAADLIAQLDDGSPQRVYGATAAMETQIGLGRLARDHADALHVIARAPAGPAGSAARLLLTSAAVRNADDQKMQRLALARLREAPGLKHFLQATRRIGAPDDPMIKRLLQEALAPVVPGRSLPAQLLIAASPYRSAVVQTATRLVASQQISHAERSAASGLLWMR